MSSCKFHGGRGGSVSNCPLGSVDTNKSSGGRNGRKDALSNVLTGV